MRRSATTRTPSPDRVVFRPRMLRRVTLTLAGCVLVSFLVLAWGLTESGWSHWRWRDNIWLVGIGAGISAVLLRFARIRAIATPARLRVHNFFGTREFAWPQILTVSFSVPAGDAWPFLDLSDGSTHPVMAIQATDGESAFADCDRLRRLVDDFGTAPEDPDPWGE